jgi:peptide/nickel transport system substrate-binding protein
MRDEQNFWQRDLARRRVLQGAGVGSAALATAALLSCRREAGPQPTDAAKQEAVQPRRGGNINYAGGLAGTFDTRGTGLDPYTYPAIAAIGYRLFYQGLLGYDPRTFEIQSELAQKWEQPSPTEYLLTLQPNVKWHNKPPANGRLLTADDVVFSLERARTNEPRFVSRSILTSVDKIEAPAKDRVRVTTKQPDVTTLNKLSADLLMILAPEVVERAGRFLTADTAVGTGAFIMKSLEEKVGAEYVRNPDYWKPGLPYLDSLRTIYFSDEQTAYAAFQGGQVDITRVLGTETKNYIAQRGPGFTPDWFLDNTYVFGQPNTKAKPMDDQRVTRALRLLIDHQQMISGWAEVWFGRGRHGAIFPTALQQWDLSHEEYERFQPWKPGKEEAIRDALSLLSAAGFSRETPLKFEVEISDAPFNVAFAQLYQGMWRQHGQGAIETQLRPRDSATANQIRAQRNFTYLVHGNVPGITEPDSWLTEIYRTGASLNYMNFSDPKFDEMIDKQRTIFDVAQRKAAVREIVLYYIQNGPGSIPANRYFLNATKPNIRGYAPEFYLNGSQYEHVWLEV